MRTIQFSEARTRLADLLRDVERGETVAIARAGRTVARLVPAPAFSQSECERAVDRFLERRARWAPTGMSSDEVLPLRHEGHRV